MGHSPTNCHNGWYLKVKRGQYQKYVSSPGDDLGEGISLEGKTFCRPPG